MATRPTRDLLNLKPHSYPCGLDQQFQWRIFNYLQVKIIINVLNEINLSKLFAPSCPKHNNKLR